MALQLYRQSAVGDTLNDALHEMVSEEKISGVPGRQGYAGGDCATSHSFGLVLKKV